MTLKKISITCILSIFFLIVFAFNSVFAETYSTKSGEVEEIIKLQYPDVFSKPKRGPVSFSHKSHHDDYGVKCEKCHHNEELSDPWQEGDDVNSCADCHYDPYKSSGKLWSLHRAFHKNCIGCHSSTDDAPKTCNECHD